MSEKNTPSRLLFLITAPKVAEKASDLLLQRGTPLQYKFTGMGTATSEMMDLLGLGTAEKSVIVSPLPRDVANGTLAWLEDLLGDLEKKNRGIAFTLPLNGLNKLLCRMMGDLEGQCDPEEGKEESVMSERNSEKKYTLITAIVNQGYSEEVMNAARSAGARGGTVLHSRRIADEKAAAAMGLGVQEEREWILIAARNEDKLAIMQAIGASCGVHSDAKGVVLSLPIDNAIGLQ